MMRFLTLAALALTAVPTSLLAWGQPTHGCISYNLLEKHGTAMPKVCTDTATRNTYLHASYSPDMYVLQGPEYVHLDRQFALYLFKHAKNARQLAIAYGWSTHQEEDSVGHGRYITEVGMTHLLKELTMDARFLFQGSRGEATTVREAGAAWDAEQIENASRDYAAKYGSKYPVISQAKSNTTGYVFSAYMTAVKGVLYALWYGRIKWKPDLYPRTEWQGYLLESVEQARKWCGDPFSFSNASADLKQSDRFAGLFKTPELGDEVAPVREEAPLVESSETLANVAAAVGAYQAQAKRQPMVSPFGNPKDPERANSHLMLQSERLVALGQKLMACPSIKVEERAEGGFHEVRCKVVSKRKFMVDMARLLKESGAVGTDARVAPGAGGTMEDFFTSLAQDAEKAAQEAPEEPEN